MKMDSVIILGKPDVKRGVPVMTALAQRASVREFDSVEISLKDLSDLLWAANGVNRPEEGKRTAPSAQNAQDVDIFVFTKDAVLFYNAMKHQLELVTDGDHRDLLAGKQVESLKAPVFLLLVSDISRFRFGEEELKIQWGAIDAGMVAENILIFCASEGFQTRPRAWMDRNKIKALLKLRDTQIPVLNLPVSARSTR
jgi:nitroreductase